MILLIDAERKFDKIQHPIVRKTLNKLEVERDFLHLIKNIYQKKPQLTYLTVRNCPHYDESIRQGCSPHNSFSTSGWRYWLMQ